MVTDEEILAAYHLLAEKAGLFGEPASCAPLAGLFKLTKSGKDFSKARIVCIVTGNGLKDPDTAIKSAPDIMKLPADLAAVEKALGWG